jgi:hypothetical protein
VGKHNKLMIASEFLLNAARDYEVAKTNTDYAKCILLAGAVINICYPIIEELGGKSTQRANAELATKMMESRGVVFDESGRVKQVQKFIGCDSFVYNSLKHSGNKIKKIDASQDIFFEADLKEEAEQLIRTAISEFMAVPHSQGAIESFDSSLLDLVNSPWPTTT